MLGRRRDKHRRCVDCHLTHKPFLFAAQRSTPCELRVAIHALNRPGLGRAFIYYSQPCSAVRARSSPRAPNAWLPEETLTCALSAPLSTAA